MADIGSLVIKLAAETADFREDLGKSALLLERHAESMRGSLEKVAEVAKTTFAIAIGVESVGALKELVMHTLETVAALQDLAESKEREFGYIEEYERRISKEEEVQGVILEDKERYLLFLRYQLKRVQDSLFEEQKRILL